MGDLREQVAAYRAQHGCSLEEAMDAVVRTPPARTYTEADMRAAVVRALEKAEGAILYHPINPEDWERAGHSVRVAFAAYFRALADDPAAVAAIAEAGG